MPILLKFPTTASGTSWTNPTNVTADDGSVASYTIAAKNTTGNTLICSSFGFDELPNTVTIKAVNVIVEHRVTTTGGIANLEVAPAISGTPGTFNTDSSEPTTLTSVEYLNQARPGGGSWTRADLLDAVFTVHVRARSGNNATSVTYEWDYVRVSVEYLVPQVYEMSARPELGVRFVPE